MIRDAQQQAFSKHNVPQVNPGGRYAAPSVPISNLVFRGGGVRFQPTMRGNLLTAVAGVAAELLVEPVADVISDYVINPMIGAVLGKDIPPAKELRRIQIMKKEIELKDAKNERLYQQKSDEAQLPITEEEAPQPPVLPEAASYASRAALKPYPQRSNNEAKLGASQSHFKGVSKTHSRSQDDPNCEYKIRGDALGNNPTKEEIDAVIAYGLAQHRENFTHLYE